MREPVQEQLNARYERAARWLVNSVKVNDFEGSSAWQSRVFHPIGSWSHPYPETTGYLIPTFYDYLETGGPLSQEIGQCIDVSVRWLLSLQMEGGGFPAGHFVKSGKFKMTARDYVQGRSRPAQASVFNSGQIMLGLLRHYASTGEPECHEAIIRCADFLNGSIAEDGSWRGDPYAGGRSPAYFSYVAWPLLEAWTVIGNESYREKALLSLEHIAGKADPATGYIPGMGFQHRDVAHTHTVGYTIAGLLESARIVGDAGEPFRDVASRALERIFRVGELRKRMAGGFGGDWKPDWSYVCVTGNSQLGLCYLDVYELADDPRYLNAACRLHSDVTASQSRNGGFPGSVPIWGKYMSFRWPTWAGKFYMDLTHRLMFVLGHELAQGS